MYYGKSLYGSKGNSCQFFLSRQVAGSTPGGARFTKEIGVKFANQTMDTTTNFIWKMFEENTAAERKDQQKVLMTTDDRDAEAMGYGNTINVSAIYLLGYQGNLKWEFTSLIYHEMTHIWQWSRNGQAPGGLIESIVDYTILKTSQAWHGWDQGYDFTVRFLEYCDGLRPGFVVALNKKMRNAFSLNYFVELFGKPVDQLWKEYKAKCAGQGVVSNGSENENVSRIREYKDRYEGKRRIIEWVLVYKVKEMCGSIADMFLCVTDLLCVFGYSVAGFLSVMLLMIQQQNGAYFTNLMNDGTDYEFMDEPLDKGD
ncbi:uncharacterized protein LOC114261106 [Camellia sinensis]|uniref:uncharacterized protein LOC114261106 n=1 Tax=Camellia sinensis TaxID=4442 RepID=UPI001035BF2A|nr:uncharacterized protein LOC114261106 [Camellia sinensis]